MSSENEREREREIEERSFFNCQYTSFRPFSISSHLNSIEVDLIDWEIAYSSTNGERGRGKGLDQ
jgi:hypothetical protein